MMNKLKPIAVLLLVVLGLVSIASSAIVSRQAGEAEQAVHNSTSLMFDHYQCVRQAAGAARQLGYISPFSGDPTWDNPYVDYYEFAKFSLAPLVLTNGIGSNALVAAYYPDPSQTADVMARLNLTLIKDCGEGVYLLARNVSAQ